MFALLVAVSLVTYVILVVAMYSKISEILAKWRERTWGLAKKDHAGRLVNLRPSSHRSVLDESELNEALEGRRKVIFEDVPFSRMEAVSFVLAALRLCVDLFALIQTLLQGVAFSVANESISKRAARAALLRSIQRMGVSRGWQTTR